MEISLDPFGEIIAAGVNLDQEVPLFPTLVVKLKESIELEVLQPVPDFYGVRLTVDAWVANRTQGKRYDRLCVAYMIAPDTVEAKVCSNGQMVVFHGAIDRVECKLIWQTSQLS